MDIRLEAKKLYQSLPLPESKYTNLKWWKEERYLLEKGGDVRVEDEGSVVQIIKDLGTVGGIVKPDTNKFIALHYANLDEVIKVEFPDDFILDKPIYIKVDVGGRMHTHIVVYGGKNSRGEVVVYVKGSGLYTEVVEVVSKENSDIRLAVLEDMDDKSIVFIARGVKSERYSRSQLVGAWFGGKFVMSKHFIKPIGEEAHIEDVQVLFGDKEQHFDITTNLDFSAPYTKGESNIRAVLKDSSRAVMYGLINIEREAQFADAYLSEHAMLLNSGARADSIPGLEIMANQVRATHGATVGPIDPEKMFYLMSRGIEETEAKKLIVIGFFEPALSRIGIEEVREAIIKNVENKMEKTFINVS